LATACRTLADRDLELLAAHEAELLADAEQRLSAIPGVERYSLWGPEHPHIGVITFNLAGYHHSHLAAILSAEYGIGVRHGCFCAHPLMLRLLRVGTECADEIRGHMREGRRVAIPGAVRASFGVGTTQDDIDRLVDAVARIAAEGPAWQYEALDGGEHYVPSPDPRSLPEWPFAPAPAATHSSAE
jgi:selenocysteine lyase/cysteine desulfurase